MSSEVPEGWASVKLGDLIDTLEAGVSVNSESRPCGFGEIGVLKTSSVSGGRFRPTENKVVVNGEAGRVKVPVGANSIILSRMNTLSLVGENAYVEIEHPNLYLPDRLWMLRTNQRANCRWLSFFMQSDAFRARLTDIATGTSGSMKNISKAGLAQLSLLLPPLDEQRRIAEVLRSVDEAIAANRAMIEQLSRMRAATLHAAFEETAWEVVRLSDLGRWSSGGTPSKADEALWNGDIPWICPRDMKTPIVTRAESSVSEKAVGGACKIVPKGTLLLVVRGMILAKVIPTATTAMPATYNQDIKAFHPNGRAIPKFVQLCLQHQEHKLLKQVNTATHGTKKLDAQTIAEIEVPLPNLPDQIELANAVADMDLAMVRSGEEHVRLTVMRAALQSDLLSGRVRVPL